MLKQILEKLFCKHKWQQYKEVEVRTESIEKWHIFHFICKKCGKFKKIKSR